jgi:P4 family phage/plasmid primase-like protien
LPVFQKGQPPKFEKMKSTAGSQAGIIGQVNPTSTEVWKTEGPTDLLALLSIDLPGHVSAFTNGNGSKENPTKFGWMKPILEGKKIFVIHDADIPGQEGATSQTRHDGTVRPGWTPFLSEISGIDAVNVLLPYKIEETKGKDIRDWINEGGTYERLKQLSAKAIPAAEIQVEEADDDPERLARINIEDYKAEHGGDLRFYRDEWWKYQSGAWKKVSPEELKLKVRQKIRSVFRSDWLDYRKRNDERAEKPIKKINDQLVSNVVSAMKHMAYFTSEIEMPCWMPDRSTRNYISMRNGIVDLDRLFADREDYLLPHSPEWFSSLQLGYDFDPDCPTPKFDRWLQYISDGEPEKAMLLQEFAGYLFQQNCDEQCFLVIEGPGGTGKTTFFNIVSAIIGTENISNISLELFSDKFSLSSTIGKIANICGDIGKLSGEEEGVLKRYTGNERIQVDRKNLPHVSFLPTAKLMFAWNERPRIQDKTTGFWRRLLLVNFSKPIPEQDKVKKMSRIDFWSEERAGIFVWAICGLKRLIDQGRFTIPKSTADAMAEYRDESNPARRYFADYLEESEDGLIETGEIYKNYQEWCEEQGHKPMSSVNLSKELKNYFPKSERKQKRMRNGKRFWGYEKISWKNNSDDIVDF